MENQHRHVTGYRDFSSTELALINEGKALAQQVGAYVEKLKGLAPNTHVEVDSRWLAIGVTDLQKGFMSVIRSIARPTTF